MVVYEEQAEALEAVGLHDLRAWFLVRGAVARVAHVVSLVGDPVALICDPVALVSAVAAVAGAVAALAVAVSFVRDEVALVGLTVALIRLRVARVRGTVPVVGRPLSFLHAASLARAARAARLLRAQQPGADLAHPHPLRVVADRDAGDLLAPSCRRSPRRGRRR